MPTYDRFDIVDAHYWWNADHHNGQFSDGYLRLCKIGAYFTPSPLANGPGTDNALEIYKDLCDKDRGENP